MKKTSTILLTCAVVWTGCYYDVEEELYPGNNAPCTVGTVTFSTTITGILSSYGCYGCHVGSFPSGEVNLQGYANVQSIAQSGRLLGAISHAPGYTAMPQGLPKMAQCDINKVKAWIDAGAPNN